MSVTPAYGTRRLGIALRDAAKKAVLGVKREIIAAATLATGLGNQRISIAAFEDRFGLSDVVSARAVNNTGGARREWPLNHGAPQETASFLVEILRPILPQNLIVICNDKMRMLDVASR